jgi:hypothetical protein
MTKEMMADASSEKELTRVLKGIQDDELDLPSFLRQNAVRQPKSVSPAKKVYN